VKTTYINVVHYSFYRSEPCFSLYGIPYQRLSEISNLNSQSFKGFLLKLYVKAHGSFYLFSTHWKSLDFSFFYNLVANEHGFLPKIGKILIKHLDNQGSF